MSDLLSIGVARLHSLLKDNASSTVTYRRGASSAEVSATIGSGQHQLADGSVMFAVDAADFVIQVSEFQTATGFDNPKRGDRIEFNSITYTVIPLDTEPEWRYTTAHAVGFRVHSKKVR